MSSSGAIDVHCEVRGPTGAPRLVLLHELGGSIESWQWCDRQLGDRFLGDTTA